MRRLIIILYINLFSSVIVFFGSVGKISALSPIPSPSVSNVSFGLFGKISTTSPTPSPSLSSCPGL